MYEALRAYFVEDRSSAEVAKAFGYTPGSFRVLCHQFRRDDDPAFFVKALRGPRSQPKKSAARDLTVALRKQNHSVYEISEELKSRHMLLSPTAVREVLKEEGFAPLPRRLDEERPTLPIGPHGRAHRRRALTFTRPAHRDHQLRRAFPLPARLDSARLG